MAVNKVLFGGVPIMDITDSTVTPNTLAKGATAYAASGEKIVGTMKNDFEDFLNGTITEVEIPHGVTNINPNLFINCRQLARVTIPDTVTYIGGNAFESCTSLKSIVLPKFLDYLDYYAFFFCDNLGCVVFTGTPNYMYGRIDTSAFDSSGVRHIFVPWAEGEVYGAPWGAYNATVHYNIERNVEKGAETYISFVGTPSTRIYCIKKPNGEVLKYQGQPPNEINGVGYTEYGWWHDMYDGENGETYEGLYTDAFKFTETGTFHFWGETADGIVTCYAIYNVN